MAMFSQAIHQISGQGSELFCFLAGGISYIVSCVLVCMWAFGRNVQFIFIQVPFKMNIGSARKKTPFKGVVHDSNPTHLLSNSQNCSSQSSSCRFSVYNQNNSINNFEFLKCGEDYSVLQYM